MLSVRVEEDTDRALERLAFETGRSKAELVEKAIRRLLHAAQRANERILR